MSDDTPMPGTTRLPGVGLRLELTDIDGVALQVVRRNDGIAELHLSDNRVIRLDEDATHTLAAFMSGRYVMPPELTMRLSDALSCLRFDWCRLAPDAFAVGRTIEGLEIRARTGVTIVAILRGSIPMVPPDPAMRLAAGDELVYASPEHLAEGFERYVNEGT